MKKKIALIQMQAVLAGVETNYRHAEELMEQAMEGNPDILVLPETWNTGFYISRKLKSIADEGGKRTETFLSSFAKKHHVNVVGGSAAVLYGDDVYNRSFVFDREGRKIAEYDKVHGFSYAHEPMYFKGGDHAVSFALDDIPCSMVICYDIRFPELVRRSVLEGKVDLFLSLLLGRRCVFSIGHFWDRQERWKTRFTCVPSTRAAFQGKRNTQEIRRFLIHGEMTSVGWERKKELPLGK